MWLIWRWYEDNNDQELDLFPPENGGSCGSIDDIPMKG